MTDTGSTSSETPLVTDDHNDRGDDEDTASSNSSTSEPTSGPADDRSPQTAQFLLVVVGKSGTGKSSLCNLITGSKDHFPVSSGLSACTVEAQEKTVSRDGRTFCVMDTPAGEEGDMTQLTNSLKVRLDNFNNKVFLIFCVRCDARYAVEEHSIFRALKAAWGNSPDFNSRLIVAFTYSDKLTDDAENGENLLIDNVKRDTGANYGSLDASCHDRGTAQKEKEREEGKSAKERRLREMLDVTWPQLQQLVNDAQKYFIFNNNETFEGSDVRALLDYAAEVRPSEPAVTSQSAGQKGQDRSFKRYCKLIIALFIIAMLVLVVFITFLVVRLKHVTWTNYTTTSPVTPANSTTAVFPGKANTTLR